MMTDNPRRVDPVCHVCTAEQNADSVSVSKLPSLTGIARRLDAAVNMIDLARSDGNAALRELPHTAPLFSVVDLVTALGHLRQAAILIDGVADALEAAANQDLGSSAPEVKR